VADGTLVTFGTNLGVGVNPDSRLTMGGVATTTITAGTTAGVAAVSASAGAAVGLATVNLLPDAPYTVTLWAMPPRLTVEQTATLFAAVTDRYTNPVADGTLVTILSSLGTINPLYPVSTVSGVATATLRSNIAGTAVVTATAQGRVGTTSVIFDPGPPHTVSLTAYPTQLPADGSTTTIITATVIDHAGNVVADNTPVTFTTSLTTSFTLTPTVVGTADGVATTTLSSGVAGAATVTATAGTAAGTNTIIFTPIAFYVTVQASPASCTVGQTAQVTVTVTDQQGYPALDGTPVLFNVSPAGSITPATGFTAAGMATATLSSYVATTVTVTARVGTDFGQASVLFTPAGPFNISVTIVPDRLLTGGAHATITACATDRYSNPVADGARVDFYVEDPGKGTISPPFGPTVQGCVTATFTSGQTLGTTSIFAVSGTAAGFDHVTIVPGWWLYLPVLFGNYR
jgi:adhesin/invasin